LLIFIGNPAAFSAVWAKILLQPPERTPGAKKGLCMLEPDELVGSQA